MRTRCLQAHYDALASSRAYGGAGFSKREVARCVVAHPAVLSMSVPMEIRPMIEYLIGEVRLRPSQAVDVFKFSLEPKVEFASETMSFSWGPSSCSGVRESAFRMYS